MKDFLTRLIAPVVAAVIAASMAQGAFYQWSRTAATNGSVDPSVNWSEGMAPSSVNDSARAMMARLAEWRDDNSGLLTTGGTSTAYTVTTYEGLTSVPTDGATLVVTFHTTNGASPTLVADGGTTYALQTQAGTAVTASSLIGGRAYRLRFSLSNTAWLLEGAYAVPVAVPVGTVTPYVATTAPTTDWKLADGSCISRTTYAALFAITSTTYGVCDGSTTFGLPDLRGRTVFGYDPGNATGRMTGFGGNPSAAALASVGGSQFHVQTLAELAAHGHSAESDVSDPGHSHVIYGPSGSIQNAGTVGGTGNIEGGLGHTSGGSFTGITVATTVFGAGGSAAMPIANPGMVLNYIIKVQ